MPEKTEGVFPPEQWLRYTRHVQLPRVGAAGQLKLKNSTVLIVGAGGLGSPVSLYLAAAGIGHIILVDHDQVDISNLQRQILFDETQVGLGKAPAAKARLESLNSAIKVSVIDQPFMSDNAHKLIVQSDIVLDCTDNFATRYLINDLCRQLGKPWIFASIHQFSGQCALFTPETSCFRCLYPTFPNDVADCNAAGVLGVLPGLLGTMQANETLKFLCSLPTPLKGQLMLVDALELRFQKIRLGHSPECALCQGSNADLSAFYRKPDCAIDALPYQISVADFNSRPPDKHILIDVRSDTERSAFHMGGLHRPADSLPQWSGTLDPAQQYICYCQSGMRSHHVVLQLQELGINAYSLAGGLAAWLKTRVD